jgi:hypothetical protein
LIWIEESINRLRSCIKEHQRVEYQKDYQLIDFDLFQTAINQRASDGTEKESFND